MTIKAAEADQRSAEGFDAEGWIQIQKSGPNLFHSNINDQTLQPFKSNLDPAVIFSEL